MPTDKCPCGCGYPDHWKEAAPQGKPVPNTAESGVTGQARTPVDWAALKVAYEHRWSGGPREDLFSGLSVDYFPAILSEHERAEKELAQLREWHARDLKMIQDNAEMAMLEHERAEKIRQAARNFLEQFDIENECCEGQMTGECPELADRLFVLSAALEGK